MKTGVQMTPQSKATLQKQAVVEEVIRVVDDKVKSFKPDAADSEFSTTEALPFFEMVSRYMDFEDKIYLGLGLFGAFFLGAAMPAFCLLFGDMVDGIGGSTASDGSQDVSQFQSLEDSAILMVYVGCGVLVLCLLQISFCNIFAESITQKIKIRYFISCLEKDAAYYDSHDPTEMATKISKEVQHIKSGTGEKVGHFVMSVAAFVFGITFAFYWGWLLALILIGVFPIFILMGGVFGQILTSGVAEVMKAFTQSAGYAEQALQAIKVVKTYGREELEHSNFVNYLDRPIKVEKTQNINKSFSHGLFQTLVLGFYAYTLFWGGYLKWNQIDNRGEEYSGGAVLAILFSVIIGAMNLAGTGNHLKLITEGKIAGKIAYDTIDDKPRVNPNEKGIVIDSTSIKGNIEFENVCFKYPTRQEL